MDSTFNWIIGIGVVIGIALWVGAANEEPAEPDHCKLMIYDPRTGEKSDPACK